MYLWRALDDEGEAVDVAVQQKRDMDAAVRLLKRLLHSQPVEPESITTNESHYARRRLQHLQHSTPSYQQTHSPSLP